MPKQAVIFTSVFLVCGAFYIGASIRTSERAFAAEKRWGLELAKQDAAVRLKHARELMGSRDVANLTQGPLDQEQDMTPAIEAFMRSNIKKKADRHLIPHIAAVLVEESRKHHLDPVFLMAVIQKESRFSYNMVGSHGEIGLMQLKPSTGEWVAKRYHLPWQGKRTLFNPIMNLRLGAAYFAFLRHSFGAKGAMYVSAYNLGPKKTRESLHNNIEPKEYASDVMSNYLKFHAQLAWLSLSSLPTHH